MSPGGKLSRFQRGWYVAFAVLQLIALWRGYGSWYFEALLRE